MSLLRLGVLASGRGSNLQAIIDKCEAGLVTAEVAVVICDKENAFALERAGNHGIPAIYINPGSFETKEEYERAIVQRLKENRVELVVLAGYMRIVGKVLLGSYPNRIMNIHPALLPSFPGAHGQKDAVDYGVRFSGCTVHFVDEGMDTGPIILQAVVPVIQDDTEDTLAARILEQEHKVYSEAIQLYAEGRLEVRGRKVFIS
ncbi:MAG: phosphoribosylglycinamide formyltransferase [Bacillota bacterium]